MVRLVGVSVPEANDSDEMIRKHSMAAADFTQTMVGGKEIRISYYYQQETMTGRALGSAYLTDRTSLNGEIIKQGYGRAYTECASVDVQMFREYEHRRHG